VTFAWPLALLFLLLVPLVLAVYWWLLRRRRRQAVTYSSVALLRSVLPRRTRWQRHLPIALILLSLVALGIAAGRPHVERNVPYARTSIILALDVSGSMCSTDVKPNRLAVAQEATRAFVEDQPDDARMGLVVFSGFAELAVPPTTDREALATTIDTVTTGRGTAIGAAILTSLDAIAEVNPSVQPVGDVYALEDPFAPTSPPPPTTPPPSGQAPPSDGYVPDIIVLLTDGRNTRGIEPLDAVPHAVERRVRVYTIGFGTTNPSELSCTREQLGARAFGGGFGGGAGFGGGFGGFLVADTPTLMAVAEQTGGSFHAAEDADQLREVFEELPKEVATQREPTEITWLLAALGALLAAGAVAASIRWSPYP
jgi:Ca-activated chloride channel family protein